MTVDVIVGEDGAVNVHDNQAFFWVDVAATNVGQSPARDVRADVSLVVTNAPQFAYGRFQTSTKCGAFANAISRSVYRGKESHVRFGLWTSVKLFYENPQSSYLLNGTNYENGSDNAYAIGCVTYRMDGIKDPFQEGFIYRIAVECSNMTIHCDLLGDYSKQGLPKHVKLEPVE